MVVERRASVATDQADSRGARIGWSADCHLRMQRGAGRSARELLFGFNPTARTPNGGARL